MHTFILKIVDYIPSSCFSWLQAPHIHKNMKYKGFLFSSTFHIGTLWQWYSNCIISCRDTISKIHWPINKTFKKSLKRKEGTMRSHNFYICTKSLLLFQKVKNSGFYSSLRIFTPTTVHLRKVLQSVLGLLVCQQIRPKVNIHSEKNTFSTMLFNGKNASIRVLSKRKPEL